MDIGDHYVLYSVLIEWYMLWLLISQVFQPINISFLLQPNNSFGVTYDYYQLHSTATDALPYRTCLYNWPKVSCFFLLFIVVKRSCNLFLILSIQESFRFEQPHNLDSLMLLVCPRPHKIQLVSMSFSILNQLIDV